MMVSINPEWLQWSPDDVVDEPVHRLLVLAGRFGREYRQFWIDAYTKDVLVEDGRVNLMERLAHAFIVAIRVRADEVRAEMEAMKTPDVDLQARPLLAASLYETRWMERCSQTGHVGPALNSSNEEHE